jgi:hypothetical protein
MMGKDHMLDLMPPLPPARRMRPSRTAARLNDRVKREVLSALRGSGRYEVVANCRIPVTEQAREAVRQAGGGYTGVSLPLAGRCETIVVDMVVVDKRDAWAGAYAFCRSGAQTPLARRRIEENLRATELVLRAYLSRTFGVMVRTVTVGIVDGSARADEPDDLTIAACEVAAHFEVPFRNPVDDSLRPPEAGPAA